MSINTTKRDIRHEMADVIALLGNEYTTTDVECDPGDTAIKITKRNSEKALYIIAYSNPDDTETMIHEPTSQHTYYTGSFAKLPTEQIAARINELL